MFLWFSYMQIICVLILLEWTKKGLMFSSWAAAGLGSYVEALVRKHDVEFKVCFPTVLLFIYFLYVTKCMSAFDNIWYFRLWEIAVYFYHWSVDILSFDVCFFHFTGSYHPDEWCKLCIRIHSCASCGKDEDKTL